MITASEVLGQLTELLADVELVRADADNWRTFVGLAAQRGYGPRLTPGVAELLPDANQVAAVVADSREVGGALAVVRAGKTAHTTAGLTSALRALLELLADDWLEEETDDE